MNDPQTADEFQYADDSDTNIWGTCVVMASGRAHYLRDLSLDHVRDRVAKGAVITNHRYSVGEKKPVPVLRINATQIESFYAVKV